MSGDCDCCCDHDCSPSACDACDACYTPSSSSSSSGDEGCGCLAAFLLIAAVMIIVFVLSR